MPKHGKSELIELQERPGEGAVLPVLRRVLSPTAGGETQVQFTYDLGRAPVPDRRYPADVAGLTRAGDTTRLLFGQVSVIGGGPLRSLVIIKMSPEAVLRLLEASQSVQATFREYAARVKLAPEQLTQIAQEPSQVVVMNSNVAALAFAEREACLDFYNMSPWAMRASATRDQVQVEPVLRVFLSTALVMALLDRLASLRAELPEVAS